MSVQAMAWVIEHAPCSGSDFVVLLMIANHAHSDGTGAYPSIATLAKESRIKDRQVSNVLRNLEKQGLIETKKQGGPHRVNLYTMKMDDAKIAPSMMQ